jgi:quinol monooxygenase YgiN
MLRIAILLVLMGCSGLFAQTKEQVLYVVTFVDVSPAYSKDAADLLKQFAADSRKDQGSVRFEVLRDFARANHLTVLEVWSSRDAFERHLTATYSKQFREKIQPMLGSPFDERLHILAP